MLWENPEERLKNVASTDITLMDELNGVGTFFIITHFLFDRDRDEGYFAATACETCNPSLFTFVLLLTNKLSTFPHIHTQTLQTSGRRTTP